MAPSIPSKRVRRKRTQPVEQGDPAPTKYADEIRAATKRTMKDNSRSCRASMLRGRTHDPR
jgi:hypothetical protein